MKRFMAVLATMLVMALSVTSVFAAPSAEVSTNASVTTNDGVAVEVEELMLSSSEYAEAVDAAIAAISTTTELKVTRLTVIETLDVSAPANWDGTPVSLRFRLAGISAGDNVVVLNYNDRIATWDFVNVTSVGDGYVCALFTHFSPVMIATYEAVVPAPSVPEVDSPSVDNSKPEVDSPSVDNSKPEVDSPSVDNTKPVKPGDSWWYDEVDSPSVDNSVSKPTQGQLEAAGITNPVTPEWLGKSGEINKIEEKFAAGEISKKVYNVLVADIKALETEGPDEEKLQLQNDFVAKSGKNVKEIKESEVIYIDAEVDPVNGTWVELIGLRKIQIRPGMNLIVSHQIQETGEWENIEVKIVGNTAYGKFYSLSTVNVMEVELEPASWYYDPEIDGPVDPSTSVSPKTADNSIALCSVMLAIAACGVMVVKTRKAN